MYLHSKGIILRTTKYSESSLILDLYTEEKGRKSYIISGIRSKKSKNHAGLLQVTGLVDYIGYDKDTTSLLRIKEIKADYLYQNLPFDVLRSCLGMFLMEVCAKSIKETEANPQLFTFIRSTLVRLDQVELTHLSLFHVHFLLGLCKHLGFSIQDNYDEKYCYLSLKDGAFSERDYGAAYSLDQPTSLLMHQLINKEKVQIHKSKRNEILNMLINYYRYHVEDFGSIKSLDVLRSIFS